jgi:hypothetical protein
MPWYHCAASLKVSASDKPNPCGYWILPMNGFIAHAVTNPADVGNIRPTPFTNGAMCYTFVRGSSGFRFITDGNHFAPSDAAAAGLYAQGTSIIGSEPSAYTSSFDPAVAGVTAVWTGSLYNAYLAAKCHMPMAVFKGLGEVCGVMVPWITPGYWKKTVCDVAGGLCDATTLTDNGTCAVYVYRGYDLGATGTPPLNTTAIQVCGEDLVMCGFTGGPVIASASWP